MARRRRPNVAHEPAAEDVFWPSFADVTSTFVMILFVLVLLAYLQNLVFGRRLDATQSALIVTQSELQLSADQVRASQQSLAALRKDIEKAQSELRFGREELAASKSTVAEQELALAQSRDQLKLLQTKLEGIALLRLEVLDEVKRAIENGLARPGGAPALSVSSAGNIVIHENLVFESDSYAIKEEGKPMLARLAQAFLAVLADEKVRESIEVVMIQGHTDRRGTMSYNRDLSAKRANAVLDFLFSQVPELETKYARFFTASAYSKARPVSEGDRPEDHEKNRRIEVAVVLKDAQVRQVIDEYMQEASPRDAVKDEVPAEPSIDALPEPGQ
jgi:chemotaxis protein MotB